MPMFPVNNNLLTRNIAQRLAVLPNQIGALFKAHAAKQMAQMQQMQQQNEPEQEIEQTASLGLQSKKPEQDNVFNMVNKHGMAEY